MRSSLFFIILSTVCTYSVSASAIDNERCSDVHVLYPTDRSIVDDNVDPTAYVVIKNEHSSLSYMKTLLVHKQKKNGWYLSKQIWNDHEDQEHKNLAQVTAVQYNLDELKTDLPDQYWYSAQIDQDGVECWVESQHFDIK
ncbi:hypothetical protein BCR42DRAFT_411860 [Absidia repens]|uniref:Uncharacterized protein n=1 Tax=Absidia repens TaxID=90262 RepID=A0A1X2IMC3_9FUNG|nr:hypothetical protein BCR42DRAFT_411860 [Absidia repens]